MPRLKGKQKQTRLVTAVLIIGAAVIVVFLFTFPDNTGKKEPHISSKQNKDSGIPAVLPANNPDIVVGIIENQPRIDYSDLEKNESLKDMMAARKEHLGINNSLDMIIKSNESFTVGATTVSMQKIIEKVLIGQGKVSQETIFKSGAQAPSPIKEYGIYVVQPGDNVWNIHFRILKDYYNARGITIETLADEPGAAGQSSGIGKILKFSEGMVAIYSMVDENIAQNINLLEPLSKIVVYNMDAVFALLDEINFDNVDRLQFDGKTIWIPAKKR